MTQTQENLFTRGDTMFGVCQGMGEDLGVSPTWFRLGFAGLLFVNPTMAVALYLGLGLLVFATRLLMPSRSSASAGPVTQPEPAPQPLALANDEQPELQLAA